MAESKVTIELDATVVRKAVNAKVMPAVEKILASVDLPSRIATALLEKPKAKGDRDNLHSLMYFGSYAADSRAPIESYIDNAISEAAKGFIARTVKAEAPKIEAAFKRMMADSGNMLAKTMLASLENALRDEWSFTLDTTISAKERRGDDY